MASWIVLCLTLMCYCVNKTPMGGSQTEISWVLSSPCCRLCPNDHYIIDFREHSWTCSSSPSCFIWQLAAPQLVLWQRSIWNNWQWSRSS